ncbi:MAG TPA: hypothetical protein VJK71_01955, partial [Gemmatimonadales bacterium]|nr:hypothetical protein [Gemmatimonadales bacterium]
MRFAPHGMPSWKPGTFADGRRAHAGTAPAPAPWSVVPGSHWRRAATSDSFEMGPYLIRLRHAYLASRLARRHRLGLGR